MFGDKKALPALRSVLAPEPLLRAARDHYPIERGATCELLHAGNHDTYRIEGPNQRFVLRVYRHGDRAQPEIQWELALVDHLDAEGAAVAAPIRTVSGNRLSIVMAPEGPRPVALFQYVPGKSCQGDAMTVSHARAYGSALAAVHLRMDTFESRFSRTAIDLEYLLTQPLKALEPYMIERPQDFTYLRRLADDIRDAVVEFDSRGLTTGVCHGAASGGNAHLDARGDFAFFDFATAGGGWRAYDIATFRWGMLRHCPRKKADDNYNAFLEGYREIRGLPKIDEDAVPPFVAAHEIRRMGQAAASTGQRGHVFLNDRYFDEAVHFLHDWYKEMLAYS